MREMNVFSEKPEIMADEVSEALQICTSQILRILPEYTKLYPTSSSENLFYGKIENNNWTNGFWTGEIWLAYEFCKEECLKEAALIQCEDFYKRIIHKICIESHDMGFLYSLSCVAAYKLTGDEKSKIAALLAADNLLNMFRQKGKFIQSVDNPEIEYRMIVDTLMNLPILYWASEVTGDDKYKEVAIIHYNTTNRFAIREDGSSIQTTLFDNMTGEHIRNYTRQGYSDTSTWSRGQAWAIYGSALSYKYTGLDLCKEVFYKAASYYLEHQPADLVVYFDLIFTEGDEWPRDSSAAAAAACGFLEMARHLNDREADYYISAAKKIVKALYDNCMVRDFKNSNGLLMKGTYCCKTPYNVMSQDIGKDECTSFGDYFYMEALTRLNQDWEMYW